MTQRIDLPRTVVFALCGSFCTFGAVLPQIQALVGRGWQVLPALSWAAARQDTRFGTAESWRRQLTELTGHAPIDTLQQAEPLGPRRMACAMVVAPCTGTTLAKLDLGLSDTPVTMAAKSLLRRGLPVVVAPSTNDGLGASAAHIAALLQRKHFYFVPFGMDNCYMKPKSMVCDFSRVPQAIELAAQGQQIAEKIF